MKPPFETKSELPPLPPEAALQRLFDMMNVQPVPMREPGTIPGDLSSMELQVALDEANLAISHLRAIALPENNKWYPEAEALQKGLRAMERSRDLLDKLTRK